MTEHHKHAAAFHRIQDQSHVARVNFLLTELEAGNALLDTAEASRNPETQERSRGLAREAYDEVARHLASPETVPLSDAERDELAKLHAKLGKRLGD